MFVFHFDSSFDESTEQMGSLCPWSDLKFVKKNMRPQFLRQTDHAKKRVIRDICSFTTSANGLKQD